jgi:hypothetical protein
VVLALCWMPLLALVWPHKSAPPPASQGFSKLVELGAGVSLSESVPKIAGVVNVPNYRAGSCVELWQGSVIDEGR